MASPLTTSSLARSRREVVLHLSRARTCRTIVLAWSSSVSGVLRSDIGIMAGNAIGDFLSLWRTLLDAEYFFITVDGCQTCSTSQECGKVFCVDCRVGGVCEESFLHGGTHPEHRGVRLWKVTRKLSIVVDDMRGLMPDELINRIQLYSQNRRKNCKLLKPVVDGQGAGGSRRRMCTGCNNSISPSSIPNTSQHPVCSVQCLLDQAAAEAAAQAAADAARQAAAHQQQPRRRRRKRSPSSVKRSKLGNEFR